MASEQELAEDARHNAKMAKKKAVRDRMMAEKSGEKGLIIVHTGAGKGKSSSAFGMMLRCIAHGFPCAVVQFIKGAWDTGERRLFTTHFGELCQFYAMGEGFTWETQDKARDIAAAQAAWHIAAGMLADPVYDFVLLDELNIALVKQYVELEQVLAAVAARPPRQHVVITGRGAPEGLVAVADTVTEMRVIKHAFDAGIKAQKGIEL
jgi:cob(I)alamin adenosyltransferase